MLIIVGASAPASFYGREYVCDVYYHDGCRSELLLLRTVYLSSSSQSQNQAIPKEATDLQRINQKVGEISAGQPPHGG